MTLPVVKIVALVVLKRVRAIRLNRPTTLRVTILIPVMMWAVIILILKLMTVAIQSHILDRILNLIHPIIAPTLLTPVVMVVMISLQGDEIKNEAPASRVRFRGFTVLRTSTFALYRSAVLTAFSRLLATFRRL